MKTGGTSGKKNFGHFQLPLTVKDLHNYKGIPYEWTWIFRE